MYKRNKGFTLIELLVVIAIIGILSSVVLASLNTARQKARDARRISDIKSLQLALELFANDNGGDYPGTLDILKTGTVVYMTSIPTDPSPTSNPQSGSGNYWYAGSGSQYHLGAELETTGTGGVPSNDADCDSRETGTTGCFNPSLSAETGAFDGTAGDPTTDSFYDQRN